MYRLMVTVEKINGYCSLPMLVGDPSVLTAANFYRKTNVSVLHRLQQVMHFLAKRT